MATAQATQLLIDSITDKIAKNAERELPKSLGDELPPGIDPNVPFIHQMRGPGEMVLSTPWGQLILTWKYNDDLGMHLTMQAQVKLCHPIAAEPDNPWVVLANGWNAAIAKPYEEVRSSDYIRVFAIYRVPVNEGGLIKISDFECRAVINGSSKPLPKRVNVVVREMIGTVLNHYAAILEPALPTIRLEFAKMRMVEFARMLVLRHNQYDDLIVALASTQTQLNTCSERYQRLSALPSAPTAAQVLGLENSS